MENLLTHLIEIRAIEGYSGVKDCTVAEIRNANPRCCGDDINEQYVFKEEMLEIAQYFTELANRLTTRTEFDTKYYNRL